MDDSFFSYCEDRLSPAEHFKLIAIIGSGPAAPEADELIGSDTIVWTINNAWRAVRNFDAFVYSDDFPQDRKPDAAILGRLGRSSPHYYPPMQRRGGLLYCGATMAIAAGYLAIETFPFSQISFFASDMKYDSVPSHFYGEGAADPLRSDVSLQDLAAKSLRLFFMGLEQGCLIVNASTSDTSRLSFPQPRPSKTLRVNLIPQVRQAMSKLAFHLRPFANAALTLEAEAPFDANVYDYWRYMDDLSVWDYVRKVDAAWALMGPVVHDFTEILESAIKDCEPQVG